MAPQPTSSNGVLPAPAGLLKKKDGAPTGRGPRKQTEKLKGVIRRLPPALTQAEFVTILGEEWKVGKGKITWLGFKAGKLSTDPSKPSRPARAYVNVAELKDLLELEEAVKKSSFVDAKNSYKDAALIAPPQLVLATYQRVPLGKRRTDARQGTIDQDPEFIDFLQSLTNPLSKPAALDAEPTQKREEVKTTPLIEHLREKKAAKEKAGKAGKGKQQDAKESKAEKGNKKGAKGQAADGQEKGKKLTKAEKAAKEAVKVLNKEAAAVGEKSANAQGAAKEPAERKPERAARPISVAARIQQDLGLAPAGRRAKRDANAEGAGSTPATSSSDANASTTTSVPKRGGRGAKAAKASEKPAAETSGEPSKPVPTGPAQPKLLKRPAQPPKGNTEAQPTPPKGPKAQQIPAQPSASSASTGPSSTSTETAAAPPAAPSRQAFLKHANPSQGITEPLIEEALRPYGAVEKVEIDRKKGFAYVDFVDNEGMKKAIAASPIKVAQGAVEVKERKEKGQQHSGGGRAAPTAPMGMQRGGGGGGSGGGGGGGFRGGRRGGRGGGRGGTAAAGSPSPAAATPAAGATSSAPSAPAPPAT